MKNLNEIIGKITKQILKEHEWNLHFGKNHNGEPYHSESKYMCHHDTGQFGSGTFFSTYNTSHERHSNVNNLTTFNKNQNPEFIQIDNGVYRVDFDLYKNLYRVYNEKQGEILHTMMSDLNGFFASIHDTIHEYNGYHIKNSNFSNSTRYQKIATNAKALGLTMPSYLKLIRMAQELARSGKSDVRSFATVFMEYNGFNGVNVSGVPAFDNTRHGSVIYDLSKVSSEITPLNKDKGIGTTVGHGAWHTLAGQSFTDEGYLESLNGKLNMLFSSDFDEKKKFRMVKNIVQQNGRIKASDIKCHFDEYPKIKNYIINMMYRGKFNQEELKTSEMADWIVENNLYQFINCPANDERNSFLIDFLSRQYWETYWIDDEEEKKEMLNNYLQKMLSMLKRPLTKNEEEYIKNDYFDM